MELEVPIVQVRFHLFGFGFPVTFRARFAICSVMARFATPTSAESTTKNTLAREKEVLIPKNEREKPCRRKSGLRRRKFLSWFPDENSLLVFQLKIPFWFSSWKFPFLIFRTVQTQNIPKPPRKIRFSWQKGVLYSARKETTFSPSPVTETKRVR